MANLPDSNSSYNYANRRNHKTNFQTKTRTSPDSPLGQGYSSHKTWLTGEQFTKYQAMLLYTPEVTMKIGVTSNPASLIPTGSEVGQLLL